MYFYQTLIKKIKSHWKLGILIMLIFDYLMTTLSQKAFTLQVSARRAKGWDESERATRVVSLPTSLGTHPNPWPSEGKLCEDCWRNQIKLITDACERKRGRGECGEWASERARPREKSGKHDGNFSFSRTRG